MPAISSSVLISWMRLLSAAEAHGKHQSQQNQTEHSEPGEAPHPQRQGSAVAVCPPAQDELGDECRTPDHEARGSDELEQGRQDALGEQQFQDRGDEAERDGDADGDHRHARAPLSRDRKPGASPRSASENTMRDAPYRFAFRADSRATTATRVMAVAAPGMRAASRTPANGENSASEVAGRTAAITKTEPM